MKRTEWKLASLELWPRCEYFPERIAQNIDVASSTDGEDCQGLRRAWFAPAKAAKREGARQLARMNGGGAWRRWDVVCALGGGKDPDAEAGVWDTRMPVGKLPYPACVPLPGPGRGRSKDLICV